MLRRLATFLFSKGYISSGLKFINDNDSLGVGSKNLIFTGTGANRIFKGIARRVGILGSKTLENVGDGYGGLGRPSDTTAIGSVFRVLGAIFYIGAGRLYYNGADAGDSATSTLKLKKFTDGVLGTDYDVGLAQPSAPTIEAITPPTGFTGRNNGTVSVKLARVRSATGARSIASETSNVVTCINQSVLIKDIPAVDDNGQDYWEVDVTMNGFGGVGNHYYLKEIKESDIATTTATATITATSVATEVTLPNGTFTTAKVGWKAVGTAQWKYITCAVGTVGAGNAKTVVTAAGLTGSPLTLTFAVSAGASATDVATALYDKLTAETGTGKVMSLFDVYRDGATVYMKKKSGTDTTMNFTLENDTSTNITAVTTASTGTINTWVSAVGGNDSGGSGKQKITFNGAIGIYSGQTDSVTFTNAVSGVTRSYAVEWADGDLAGADLAPIYDYPPPAGRFGGVLGDVVFVDGALGDTGTADSTTGGNAIAISEPARPESFAPDNYIFTNDSPVALLPGSQGLYWRFGKNSLGVIRYIGNKPALTYERLWTGIGIQSQNNCTLGAGGRLYAYTGARGAVRVGPNGEPDTSFAARVAEDMAGWTASNVVLGYDANYQYVFYAHGQTILAYFEPMDAWCAPLDLSATLGNTVIKAMVTYNSEVYIAVGPSSAITSAIATPTENETFEMADSVLTVGDVVRLTTTGALPLGYAANTDYHVVWKNGNQIKLSLTDGGTAIAVEDEVLSGTTTMTVYQCGLYSFDTGSGTEGKFVTQWQASQLSMDVVSRVKVALKADASTVFTLKTYRNGNDTSVMAQNFEVPAGLQIMTPIRPNLRNAKAWKLEGAMTSAGGDARYEAVAVEGDASGIVI